MHKMHLERVHTHIEHITSPLFYFSSLHCFFSSVCFTIYISKYNTLYSKYSRGLDKYIYISRVTLNAYSEWIYGCIHMKVRCSDSTLRNFYWLTVVACTRSTFEPNMSRCANPIVMRPDLHFDSSTNAVEQYQNDSMLSNVAEMQQETSG